MKKITLLMIVMMVSLFAKVDFVKDYRTALAMAKDENKKILVMLTAKDCTSCWWMKNVAFKDEALSEQIKKHIIAVEVDVNTDKIPLNLGYIGTPTFYLLDTKEDQLSRIDGRLKPDKFRKRLSIFLD